MNPFGPTLNVAALLGVPEAGATLPVAHLTLNPFSPKLRVVGELPVGGELHLWAVLPELFELPFGGCPTLLLPSTLLEPDESLALHARFLQRFPDAREVLARVREYFGNPWDRVSAEVRAVTESALEMLAGVGEGGAAGGDFAPLDEEGALELARLLLSEQHMKPELNAFLYAWDGSIRHGPRDLASMSFAEFSAVFAHLGKSCYVPDTARDAG